MLDSILSWLGDFDWYDFDRPYYCNGDIKVYVRSLEATYLKSKIVIKLSKVVLVTIAAVKQSILTASNALKCNSPPVMKTI
jgi:hypothetical protein